MNRKKNKNKYTEYSENDEPDKEGAVFNNSACVG